MLCFILFFVFLFYSSCYFHIFRIFYRIFIVVSSFYYYYFNFIYHVLFLYFIYCIFFTAFIGLKAHFWLKTWTQNDPGPGPQQQAKPLGQRRPRSADSPSDPASFPRGPSASRPPAGLPSFPCWPTPFSANGTPDQSADLPPLLPTWVPGLMAILSFFPTWKSRVCSFPRPSQHLLLLGAPCSSPCCVCGFPVQLANLSLQQTSQPTPQHFCTRYPHAPSPHATATICPRLTPKMARWKLIFWL